MKFDRLFRTKFKFCSEINHGQALNCLRIELKCQEKIKWRRNSSYYSLCRKPQFSYVKSFAKDWHILCVLRTWKKCQFLACQSLACESLACESLACQSLEKDCMYECRKSTIKLKKYGLRTVVLIWFQEINNIPKIIDAS